MKKLKKFAALLLVGVMALALLTACGVAATLPRSAYYDALQLNYYVREAFATGWLLLRGN